MTATLIRSYIQRESSLWQLHWLDCIFRGSHHCDSYIDYILYTERHHCDSFIDYIVYSEGVFIVTATLIRSYIQRESSLWQLHWLDCIFRGSHHCDSYIDYILYTESHHCDSYIDYIVYSEGVTIVTATLIWSFIQRESSLWQLHWLYRIFRGSHHCDSYID